MRCYRAANKEFSLHMHCKLQVSKQGIRMVEPRKKHHEQFIECCCSMALRALPAMPWLNLRKLDVTISFQRRNQNVNEPEGHKQRRGEELGTPWATQLTAKRPPPQQKRPKCYHGTGREDNDAQA